MENLTSEQLKEKLANGDKVLVQISGVWCGPCKQLTPTLERIENDYPNVDFVKIDVNENEEYVLELGIRSVPTVIFYSGTNILNKSTGVKPETFYVEQLKNMS